MLAGSFVYEIRIGRQVEVVGVLAGEIAELSEKLYEEYGELI